MYTKQEISRQKQAFWTAFGGYMKPILSADGEKIGWINYNTGNKHIQFKLDADNHQALIAIVTDKQEYFEKFRQLRSILEETLEEKDWTWQPATTDEHGKPISIIEKTLSGVNIVKTEDWPAIISFLKPRIIALDNFWSMVRYQFTGL